MIVLVRHGRTAANASGLLLGRADPELDAEGQLQAARLAEALSGEQVARVVSSPLVRCRQTAAAVAGALGVPVEVDDRWIELDYGELDGTATASIPPETWAKWMADVAWAPPGGESLARLGERVRVACDELARESDDVVVVSHVSPIKAAVAWALGVGDEVAWRLFLAPASMTRIAASGSRRSLHAFNQTTHLA